MLSYFALCITTRTTVRRPFAAQVYPSVSSSAIPASSDVQTVTVYE